MTPQLCVRFHCDTKYARRTVREDRLLVELMGEGGCRVDREKSDGFLTVDGWILGYLALTVNIFGMVVIERNCDGVYEELIID